MERPEWHEAKWHAAKWHGRQSGTRQSGTGGKVARGKLARGKLACHPMNHPDASGAKLLAEVYGYQYKSILEVTMRLTWVYI